MIIVSDASPIIGLAAVKKLELLRSLYGRVFIPEAVYHEIAVVGRDQPGASEVQLLSNSGVTILSSQLERFFIKRYIRVGKRCSA